VWFIPVGSKVAFLIGVFMGMIAITLIMWFTMKVASRSLGRIIIQTVKSKEEAYVLMFHCGFGIVCLTIAVSYFFFLACFMMFRRTISYIHYIEVIMTDRD
jgi:hypothetical protein